MVKFSGNLLPFLLLISVASSLTIVCEFSGEFGKIRQLSSETRNVLNITKGEFVSLNNGVLFGFDIDSGENDVLKVKLSSNQTFGWHNPIEKGKRIIRSENFTLDTIMCIFEVDVSVMSYNKQTLQIIDNTKPSC